MFRQLTDGIRVGRGALDQAQQIEEEHGFADEAAPEIAQRIRSLSLPSLREPAR